jgi:hypothetical protein
LAFFETGCKARVTPGGDMDFLSNINFEVILQLTMLVMIVIAGPAVVALLWARGGDL